MNTLSIPLAFVLCSVLLLWHVIASKGYWTLKAFTISVTLFFGLSLWHSIDTYLGWPTPTPPPAKFVFHWGLVKEPSSNEANDGVIYVWLKEIKADQNSNLSDPLSLLSYADDGKEPRVHKLPYSKEMAKAVKGAKGKVAKGKAVVGEFKEGKMGEQGNGDGDGEKGDGPKGESANKSGKKGEGGWDHRGLAELRFYDLPPARYPDKMSEPQSQADQMP